MLTEAMTAMIETYTIGCVASVRADGTPAVSPKGTFLVVDPRTIAFADIRSSGTVGNLRARPGVEVDFIDVFRRQGCRVRGMARCTPRTEADPHLLARFESKWPDLYGLMQGIIVIAITAAEIVVSPAYDVGALPAALGEHWLRRYAATLGFEVSRRPGTEPHGPGDGR